MVRDPILIVIGIIFSNIKSIDGGKQLDLEIRGARSIYAGNYSINLGSELVELDEEPRD